MRSSTLITFVVTVFLSLAGVSQDKHAIIAGTVKDAGTKSPLNDAVVTIRSDSFKGEKYALTDSAGMYRVNNLPPGTYSVAFEMEGYQKFSKDGIVLSPGMSLGVSFEMIKERKQMKRTTVSNK
jgi:hypothetical protein